MQTPVSSTSTVSPSEDTRWQRLYSRKLEVELTQAFKLFRRHGVEPVLIKGWASARNYPEHSLRFYTDIDLAVSAEDFGRANSILASEEGRKVGIDLHKELRHLDTKPWKSILEDSQVIELDGCSIRVPSAEDHLRILAVHWMNDGGERKDRLWDIYYQALADGFDWDRCLSGLTSVRRGWIVAAMGLTVRYLDFPVSDLPFADEAANLPPWLIRTVEREWRSGVLHRSLHTCLNDPAEFVRQLRKRLPPNPLQATVECEAYIDKGSRVPYQVRCLMKRSLPSVRGLAQTIKLRFQKDGDNTRN